MMMDHYCLLLIKVINTATIYHVYGLTITITITRQCGGTPISFASVLFNSFGANGAVERRLKVRHYTETRCVSTERAKMITMLRTYSTN